MIDVICATRLPEREFWETAALGQSLLRLKADSRLVPYVRFENTLGLPDIYNARISSLDSGEFLVFVHDDVWIDDHFVADRVIDGLKAYDIIGVAGNRRRARLQPTWCFCDPHLNWDDKANLSGAVAHGQYPFSAVSFFGAAPADCELLDGLFLAVRKSSINASGVRFDPRFKFHFYDVDFCRSARQQKLRLGSWPICLTHQSGGAFGAPEWIDAYQDYLAKWGD